MSKPMIGKDAIAMLREIFGIKHCGIREIRLVARYDSVALLEVDGIAFDAGAEVSAVDATDAESDVTRYLVEIRKADA